MVKKNHWHYRSSYLNERVYILLWMSIWMIFYNCQYIDNLCRNAFVIFSSLIGNLSISVFCLVLWNLWEIFRDIQHANYWLGRIASNANQSIGNVVASHSLSLMKARGQVRCKKRPVRRYTFEIALQGFTFLNWVNENITEQWHKISPKMSISLIFSENTLIICTSAL